MTLKKVGESFSFSSSSHRVNPLKEFVSDCSNLWAPQLSTAFSLFSPSSWMPYIYRKQKKNKNRKRKQPHTHIVIPVHEDAFYLKKGTLNSTWISGSCKFNHISNSFLPISFNWTDQADSNAGKSTSVLSKDSLMREEHWRSDWVQQAADSSPWKKDYFYFFHSHDFPGADKVGQCIFKSKRKIVTCLHLLASK